MTHLSLPIALAAAASLTATASSQTQTRAFGGYNYVKLSTSVSTATTDVRCWAAEYLNGEIFVTADGLSGSNTAPHDIYVFNTQGQLVRQFTQSPHTDTSRLGWFDLATDGQSLLCGSELGIHVIDTNGNLVNTVQANNGPQAITQPITGPALGVLTLFSGVAYDPGGNGGNGSIWVGDSGGDLFEIDLQGNVLTQHTNLDNWFVRGLARDTVTGNMWVSAIPHRGFIGEVDLATGRATGRVLERASMQFQGGLGAVSDGAFGARFDVIEFTQTNDTFDVHRVHLHPNIRGWTEPRLLSDTGAAAGPLPTNFSDAIKPFRAGAVVAIQLDSSPDPALNGTPAVLFWNFGPDAQTTATTRIPFLPGNPILPELVAPNPFSVPVGPFFVQTPFVVGGQVLVPVPANLAFMDGDRIRIQALYLHPRSPLGLIATNDQIYEAFGSNIVAEVVGPSSLAGDPKRGFFSVVHTGGSPIVDLVLDFVTSTNGNHLTGEFDTDSDSVGFRFDGGTSAIVECGNSFRDGGDARAGLLYDGANTPPSCDPAADSGWIGTAAGNNTNDYRTLQFRFAPGAFDTVRFHFDCDTDGFGPDDGGSHAGLTVTITLQDGTVHTGQLAVDPNNAQRAFITF